MFWSTGKTKELAAFVEDGLSASQIGGELGMTRNAIIGKCNREGFKLQQGPAKLSEATMASIIAELVDGRLSQKDIAKRYGLTGGTISYINTGFTHSQKTGATPDIPLRANDVHLRHRALGMLSAARATKTKSPTC